MEIRSYHQSPGEAGIFEEIEVMRSLVNESQALLAIRDRAVNVTLGCERDRLCEDEKISAWVRESIQFVDDPPDKETIFHPRLMEARIKTNEDGKNYVPVYGDCDDIATYLAALLKGIGHQPKFRVLTKSSNEPLHHVAITCHHPYLDATMPEGTTIEVARYIDVDI